LRLLRLLSICAIFVAVLSGGGRVALGIEAAGEPRRVAIRVVGCEPELAHEAQRILAIELRATLVDAASESGVTRATVACGGGVANISVVDPTLGKAVERSVAFTDTPPKARARLLALAVAELVVASGSELESTPLPPAPPPTPPATPASERPAARAGGVAAGPVELAALFDLRLLASRDWLLGGGARAAARLSPLFFVQADALLDYAQLGRVSGSVAVTMPSLSLAIGASKDIGPALCPAISAGVRAGYVWMNGTPAGTAATGSHQQGPWLGPELLLQVSAWASERVHPVLGVSAGAYLVGVRGTIDGDRAVEAVRFWGGISAGLALR